MQKKERKGDCCMLKILWKNKLGLAAGLVVILVIAYFVNHPTVEPKDCPLCGGIKYHAPCIADLSTGEIGELAIYAPHPVLTGEIAEEQPGGTLAFLPCAGLTAVQDMDGETCTIHLPGSSLKWNPALFCQPVPGAAGEGEQAWVCSLGLI